MIGPALQFLAKAIDQVLRNQFELSENSVVINRIVESDGSEPQKNENKIVLSPINIGLETRKSVYNPKMNRDNNQFEETDSSQIYNLDILMSSNFDDLVESIKFFDEVFLFLQKNPIFDRRLSSNIPKGIDKLHLEVEQMNYSEMQNLWNSMQAKYKPSIVFRMRYAFSQRDENQEVESIITPNEINKGKT